MTMVDRQDDYAKQIMSTSAERATVEEEHSQKLGELEAEYIERLEAVSVKRLH